jgi:hypothetical protein
VLERLAAHCDFSASQALARQLEPTEARTLLALHDFGVIRLAQCKYQLRTKVQQTLCVG